MVVVMVVGGGGRKSKCIVQNQVHLHTHLLRHRFLCIEVHSGGWGRGLGVWE